MSREMSVMHYGKRTASSRTAFPSVDVGRSKTIRQRCWQNFCHKSKTESAMGDTRMAIVYIKYRTEIIDIPVGDVADETVAWLKGKLEALTHVSRGKQKILGLKAKGVKVSDDTRIGDLDLQGNSAKKPAMLLGTPDAAHERLQAEIEAQPQNQEPEDEDDDGGDDELSSTDLAERPDIVAKLEMRYQRANIVQLHEPRKTKAAVFDIDYTFFDLSGTSERPEELLRPYTKEFMTYLYVDLGFDLIIWSANSMKWIMVKLKELGLVGDDVPFKITACMDYTAMLTLSTSELGDDRKRKRRSATFDCKPLAVLWQRYKEFYHPRTTIMFDDLRRNFILNKKQGLVVKPFRHATTSGRDDREFRRLKRYLAVLAGLDSFDDMDHDSWKRYI